MFMSLCVCTCCYVTHGVGVGWGRKRSCYTKYVRAATSCMGSGLGRVKQQPSCSETAYVCAATSGMGRGWGDVGQERSCHATRHMGWGWRGVGQDKRSCYAACVRAAGSHIGRGWGGMGQTAFMLRCVCNYVLLCHAWGGVGVRRGQNVHATLPMYMLLRHTWWGWGGVGCGNNVHSALLLYVQTIDCAWLNLKFWLPPKLRAVERKCGHHFLIKGVNRMIKQWMWRQSQSVLPSQRDDDPCWTLQKPCG